MSWITYDTVTAGIVAYTDTEPTVTSPLATFEIDYDFPDLDKLWKFAFNTTSSEIEEGLTVYVKYNSDGTILDISATNFTLSTGESEALITHSFNPYQPYYLFKYDSGSISDQDEAIINTYLTGYSTNDYEDSLTVGDLVVETSISGVDSDDITEGSTNLYNVVPAGGTTGQVLKKTSDVDYNLEWGDSSGGSGESNTASNLGTGSSGELSSLSITSGGFASSTLTAGDYQIVQGTDFTTDGSGTGATITVTVDSFSVTAVSSIDVVGSGFDANDTITITQVDGITFTLSATLNVDTVTSGGGVGLFYQKDGVDLEFKSIVAGDNVSLDVTDDNVTINTTTTTAETLYTNDKTISGVDRRVYWTNNGSYHFHAYNATTGTWTTSGRVAANATSAALLYLTGDGAGATDTTTQIIANSSGLTGTVTDATIFNANSSGLTVGTVYTLPLTAGTAGQVLAFPSTGSLLEWVNNLGFETQTLTSDININGSETYDIRFGADTDGTTGNAHRIDSFGIYAENLLTFEVGDQSGDRFSVAMLPALNLMQLGAFNSSSQLTGMQWGTDDLGLYYKGSKYIDFDSDKIVFNEDIDINSGYGLAFLDSAGNRQVGWGYDESVNDAFFFYLNETDTRFSDISASADGGIGFYDTALTSTPFFQIASDAVTATVDVDLKAGTTELISTNTANDGTRSQPYITLHEGAAFNGGFINISNDTVFHWRVDGSTTTAHSLSYNDTDDQFEEDFYGVKHETWNIDEYNMYFDSASGTNEISIYDADPDSTPTQIYNFNDSGDLTVSGDVTANSFVGQVAFERIWGEESSTFNSATDSGYQYSYGNGETGQYGGVVVSVESGWSCQATSMTFGSKTACVGVIDLVINGVDQGVNMSVNSTDTSSTSFTLSTPITITDGDKLTFKTTSSTTIGEGPVASVKLTHTKTA